MSEIIDRLIKQADDIAKSGISGYGNTMLDAIEEIKCIIKRNAELESELARLREQEPFAWATKQGFSISSYLKKIDDGEYQKVYSIPLYAQPKPPGLPAELINLMQDFPEINMSNYGEDDVSQLNEWGIDVVRELDKLKGGA